MDDRNSVARSDATWGTSRLLRRRGRMGSPSEQRQRIQSPRSWKSCTGPARGRGKFDPYTAHQLSQHSQELARNLSIVRKRCCPIERHVSHWRIESTIANCSRLTRVACLAMSFMSLSCGRRSGNWGRVSRFIQRNSNKPLVSAADIDHFATITNDRYSESHRRSGLSVEQHVE
jgi:hypothetical protein